MGLPRGAATEHAEGGAATLHDMEDAQADRANDTMENLWFHLAEFLTLLLLDVWTVPGFRHATEQAKLVCEDDCYDIV